MQDFSLRSCQHPGERYDAQSSELQYLQPIYDCIDASAFNETLTAVFPGKFHGKCQINGVNPPGCPNPDCPVVCGTPGSMVHFYDSDLVPILNGVFDDVLEECVDEKSDAYKEAAELYKQDKKHRPVRFSRRNPQGDLLGGLLGGLGGKKTSGLQGVPAATRPTRPSSKGALGVLQGGGSKAGTSFSQAGKQSLGGARPKTGSKAGLPVAGLLKKRDTIGARGLLDGLFGGSGSDSASPSRPPKDQRVATVNPSSSSCDAMEIIENLPEVLRQRCAGSSSKYENCRWKDELTKFILQYP